MMKRLTYTLLLFILISIPLSASHIVGGEIELLHRQGFTYRLNLIYYFDVASNPGRQPQLEEASIEVYIFRKSDNTQIRTVTLLWISKTRVPYTQPHCSNDGIISDKLVYSADITLPAEQYSDPAGYYITWVRCCRNYSIDNIHSEDPTHVGAIGAGQTFYMEFPPVMVNGQRFLNSSPRNFPTLSDYACPTKPYYVDFAGVDDDGDSLAYSLVTPLSTVTVTPSPPPTPAPYPEVQWVLPIFGLDRIINGDQSLQPVKYPDLGISNAGFLRVTPRAQGLFVFAVKVDEFRNKVKIGEVRRDFQMWVTDCRVAVSPEISGKELQSTTFLKRNLSVSFANTVSNANRCIDLRIADEDSNREVDSFKEVIQLKVIPLNFKGKNIESIIPADKRSFTILGDTAHHVRICFDACPFFEGGPYQIGIIAYDDACALPLTDTLKVEVDVQPPNNASPAFVSPAEVNATLIEGEERKWNFEARDADNDSLVLMPRPDGFSMTSSGMKLKVTESKKGLLKGELEWDAFCDIYDFTKQTEFLLDLLVDDLDKCDLSDPDTATYNLTVDLPEDAEPIVDTDLTDDAAETEIGVIEKRIYDVFSFNVTGMDVVDNDNVTLKMDGDGFNPSHHGMSFPAASAKGTVTSKFTWLLECDNFNLDERSEFNIAFVAIDSSGKCRVRHIDSLVVKVKVLPPENIPPNISIVNMSEVSYDDGFATMGAGQRLDLQLRVSDADITPADHLTIDLVDIGGDIIPEGWVFHSAQGPSVLRSNFSWEPQCSIFQGDVWENDFYFDFRYSDNRCVTGVADTVRVNVKVKDVESGGFEVSPANVFTPNDDGYNDYYSMERRDGLGNLINILPPDNCRGAFESVRIYNRWGRTVFTSTDRNFRWLGLEEAAGVYFYHVVYSNRSFKGTVSLRD
jgi:hypothetical protein